MIRCTVCTLQYCTDTYDLNRLLLKLAVMDACIGNCPLLASLPLMILSDSSSPSSVLTMESSKLSMAAVKLSAVTFGSRITMGSPVLLSGSGSPLYWLAMSGSSSNPSRFALDIWGVAAAALRATNNKHSLGVWIWMHSVLQCTSKSAVPTGE